MIRTVAARGRNRDGSSLGSKTARRNSRRPRRRWNAFAVARRPYLGFAQLKFLLERAKEQDKIDERCRRETYGEAIDRQLKQLQVSRGDASSGSSFRAWTCRRWIVLIARRSTDSTPRSTCNPRIRHRPNLTLVLKNSLSDANPLIYASHLSNT